MSYSLVPPICSLCAHYEGGLNDLDVTRCAAFPVGIPSAILDDLFDHRVPIDSEITTFSARPGVSPEMVEEWAEMVKWWNDTVERVGAGQRDRARRQT